MSGVRIAVTGMGAATSLGLDVDVACAAARAGLAQPVQLDHEFHDEGKPHLRVAGHVMGLYTKGFTELGRWVRVGSLGLRNLMSRAGLDAKDLGRHPFFVNLPSGYYDATARQRRPKPASPPDPTMEPEAPSFDQLKDWYEESFVAKVFAAVGVRSPPMGSRLSFGDEVGAVSLLEDARDTLVRGNAHRVIVGGVDSLVDPYWLTIVDELGILKTESRPVGFMPGEASAFIVLETEATARRRGAPILGFVDGLSVAREKSHRFGPTRPAGLALAEVVTNGLAAARGACDVLYGDLNGDAVRAFDWGSAQARLQPSSKRKDIFPVESFGATRAAAAFVSICLAARAYEKSYAKSEAALIWLISDEGGRGSITLGCPS